MKMPQSDRRSLWSVLSAAGHISRSCLWGAHSTVALSDLERGSTLAVSSQEFRGRSVLVATADQLTAALALIELDGIARRIVLCPPDLPLDSVRLVAASAKADSIVSDRVGFAGVTTVSPRMVGAPYDRSAVCQTEWVLFTSGTTAMPKMVVHSLASLAGAIETGNGAAGSACTEQGAGATGAVWSTFYDIRRYGGLQIFLRAIVTGASLLLSSVRESTADFLTRAGAHGVTHISGTPSHWRRALMSPAAVQIAPRYIRLSGEIADQAILDHLRASYPGARVAHAFASTEAGVAFDVDDGQAGFPASAIERPAAGVEMKVEDGSLRIRSPRIASRYLGQEGESIAETDGFVDTRDMLELRDGRYYFVGRRDGIINVGGLKVHPEEVEGVINRHPDVRMSLVRTRKNPITGSLVVADIVSKSGESSGKLRIDILEHCRQTLPRHKVPATIQFVASLHVSPTGKLVRPHA